MALTSGGCLAAALAALVTGGATAATIGGSATYRERIALPPDATFEATLEDVSPADAAATVIGRSVLMPAGQVPIRFELPYAEASVQPGHRYAVRAHITHGGRRLFATTQTYPVLTSATAVELMLQRVSESPSANADRTLTNTYWKLIELDGAPVRTRPEQREPHLILHAEQQRLAGSGGCNRLLGSYTLDGAAVSFGKLASTMMACHEGMAQETAFFRALERVRSWNISGDGLALLGERDDVIARFGAVDLR